MNALQSHHQLNDKLIRITVICLYTCLRRICEKQVVCGQYSVISVLWGFNEWNYSITTTTANSVARTYGSRFNRTNNFGICVFGGIALPVQLLALFYNCHSTLAITKWARNEWISTTNRVFARLELNRTGGLRCHLTVLWSSMGRFKFAYPLLLTFYLTVIGVCQLPLLRRKRESFDKIFESMLTDCFVK